MTLVAEPAAPKTREPQIRCVTTVAYRALYPENMRYGNLKRLLDRHPEIAREKAGALPRVLTDGLLWGV